MRKERTEQVVFVARVREFYPDVLIFAIPNGGSRRPGEGAGLKAQGVLAGVPDVFVAEPRGHWAGLFVEMKREDGGRTTDAQDRVQEELVARGYSVVVAAGAEEAWRCVEVYLRLPRPRRSRFVFER